MNSIELFTTADGLSGKRTIIVQQDHLGFIWLVNDNKLHRYDGHTFLVYPGVPDALQDRINVTALKNLLPYQDSLLLFLTLDKAFTFNPCNGTWKDFDFPKVDGNTYEYGHAIQLSESSIYCLVKKQGNPLKKAFWYLNDGVFSSPVRLDKHEQKLKHFKNSLSSPNGVIYQFTPDTLWGFDKSGQLISQIALPKQFTGQITYSVNFDRDGRLIAQANSQLFIYNSGTKSWEDHPFNRFVSRNQFSIYHFKILKDGSIWAGGLDGMLMNYSPDLDTVFDFKSNLKELAPYNFYIGGIFEDRNGTLWIDIQMGLLKINPNANSFDTYFSNKGNDTNQFSFRGITESPEGIIYASYYIGGATIDPKTKKARGEQFPVKMPFGVYMDGHKLWLNNGEYWDVRERKLHTIEGSITKAVGDAGLFTKDKKGTLWWMLFPKLFYLKETSSGLKWEEFLQVDTRLSPTIDAFYAGQQSGRLWFGIGGTLMAVSPPSPNISTWNLKQLGYPVQKIMAVEEDKQGALWIGTDIGLIYFEPKNSAVRRFTEKDGLANNQVCGMLSEGDSCLWLSTNNGLSRFDVRSSQFINFYKEDGLTNNEFNRASSFKAKDGRMFFGGIKGINAFFPEQLMQAHHQQTADANLVLSFFEHVDAKRDTFVKEIHFSQNPTIHLYSRDRSFTFEFALTNFANPKAIRYSYQMSGYEESWSLPSQFNFARYSSLPSGTYTFRVKAQDFKGNWHPKMLEVTVIMHPPWWARWWAYLLYCLILGSILLIFRRYELSRKALETNLRIEHMEATKLKELDHFKSQLYTNLTHEFRTPLTVILGMTKQIKENPQKHLGEGLQLIESNSLSLLNLINQLLDLSKLENQSFQLHPFQGDIVQYLRYVVESFQTYANGQNLSLRFVSGTESYLMDFDPEALKQVATNLLSNAIKFTPSGGEILVRTYLKENQFGLDVSDTGIGIEADKLPHIFDRFYQADSSHTRKIGGTGIGLAHTRQLIRVMNGSIQVESEPGKGTCVSISLPIQNNEQLLSQEFTPQSFYPKPIPQNKPVAYTHHADTSGNGNGQDRPSILIIEDNPDVVIYLKSCLDELYEIDVALNGEIGVEKAIQHIPDLIISDLMMPGKDGFEVCAELKQDIRTSHIPIILLTAKATKPARISGLRHGADAYLIKPFDKEELLVRLEMLIKKQQSIIQYLSSRHAQSFNSEHPATGDAILKEEEAFIQRVTSIVAENFGDEDFVLPQLCQKVGMSRSQLFRKMKALMGTSPSEFIRSYRLSHAKKLLETGNITVSEAAWQVGYKDLAHFSKSYQEKFGFPPSTTHK